MSELVCQTCKKTLHPQKDVISDCNVCKQNFCSVIHFDCFVEHKKLTGCKGSHRTILDPTFTVNLRKPKNAD